MNKNNSSNMLNNSELNRRKFLEMSGKGALGAAAISSIPFASTAFAQEGEGPFIESISGGAVAEGSIVQIRGANLGGGNIEDLCILARGEDDEGSVVSLRALEGNDEFIAAEVGAIPPDLVGEDLRVQVGVGEGQFLDGRDVEVNGFEIGAPVHLTSVDSRSVSLSDDVITAAEGSSGEFSPIGTANNNVLNFGLGGDWFPGTTLEFEFHLRMDTNGDGVFDQYCDVSMREIDITEDMTNNECTLKVASMMAAAFADSNWSSIQVNVNGGNIQVTTDPSSGHTIVSNFCTYLRFK